MADTRSLVQGHQPRTATLHPAQSRDIQGTLGLGTTLAPSPGSSCGSAPGTSHPSNSIPTPAGPHPLLDPHPLALTSSRLLVTSGLSGSPQEDISSTPRLPSVSSSPCSESISSRSACGPGWGSALPVPWGCLCRGAARRAPSPPRTCMVRSCVRMASGSPPASSSPSTSCWVSLSVRASSERPCQKRSASASSSRSQRSCSWQRPRRQPHWDSSCAVRSWIPVGHERDRAQPGTPQGAARDPAHRHSPEQGHGPTGTPHAQGCAAMHAHPPTGPCLPLRAGTSGSSVGVCCLHAGQQLAALGLDGLQGHPQLLQLAQGQAVLTDLLPKVGRVTADRRLALQAALQPLQALQQQVHALGQLGKVHGEQPGHLRGSPGGTPALQCRPRTWL